MTRYRHITWRLVAVMAFAGTAVLAVTLTGAPVHDRPALSSDSPVGTCAVAGLEAWLGPDGPARAGMRAAGGAHYILEFTNVSGHPCGLFGYPDVSAYAGSREAGAQIGAAAAHDMSVRPRLVVLAPGATAHSVLRVAGVRSRGRSGCGRVIAPELRVVLPDAERPAFVRVRVSACSRMGPAFMSVQPIQARPGVPGRARS